MRYDKTAMSTKAAFAGVSLLLLLAAPALAEPCPLSRVLRDGGGDGSTPTVEAGGTYTYTINFPTKTVSSGTVTCVDRARPRGAAIDASPAGIVSAGPTGSGENLTFTVYPDNGVTAGARSGHSYQCTFVVTTTDAGYKPTVSVCASVRELVWQP